MPSRIAHNRSAVSSEEDEIRRRRKKSSDEIRTRKRSPVKCRPPPPPSSQKRDVRGRKPSSRPSSSGSPRRNSPRRTSPQKRRISPSPKRRNSPRRTPPSRRTSPQKRRISPSPKRRNSPRITSPSKRKNSHERKGRSNRQRTTSRSPHSNSSTTAPPNSSHPSSLTNSTRDTPHSRRKHSNPRREDNHRNKNESDRDKKKSSSKQRLTTPSRRPPDSSRRKELNTTKRGPEKNEEALSSKIYSALNCDSSSMKSGSVVGPSTLNQRIASLVEGREERIVSSTSSNGSSALNKRTCSGTSSPSSVENQSPPQRKEAREPSTGSPYHRKIPPIPSLKKQSATPHLSSNERLSLEKQERKRRSATREAEESKKSKSFGSSKTEDKKRHDYYRDTDKAMDKRRIHKTTRNKPTQLPKNNVEDSPSTKIRAMPQPNANVHNFPLPGMMQALPPTFITNENLPIQSHPFVQQHVQTNPNTVEQPVIDGGSHRQGDPDHHLGNHQGKKIFLSQQEYDAILKARQRVAMKQNRAALNNDKLAGYQEKYRTYNHDKELLKESLRSVLPEILEEVSSGNSSGSKKKNKKYVSDSDDSSNSSTPGSYYRHDRKSSKHKKKRKETLPPDTRKLIAYKKILDERRRRRMGEEKEDPCSNMLSPFGNDPRYINYPESTRHTVSEWDKKYFGDDYNEDDAEWYEDEEGNLWYWDEYEGDWIMDEGGDTESWWGESQLYYDGKSGDWGTDQDGWGEQSQYDYEEEGGDWGEEEW